ncbi:MAG: hypothetical protein JWM81_360 [Candidatus Saccharibacteria bacterium]|nr:hypothetical protein [Candidatus Saccharibacteria bacterium]
MSKLKEKNTQAYRYRQQFRTTVVKCLPHHMFLVTSVRLRAKPITKLLSLRLENKLHTLELKHYPADKVEAYLVAATAAKLWHGTGRLQYRDGRVVDIFAAILSSGSLNPVKDVYTVLLGGEEMISISTTPLRIIARSYADTHGRGDKEKYRYGSSLWWVAYYYSIFFGEVFTRYGLTIWRNWSKWDNASSSQTGERQWGRKVNKAAISVWDVFGSGSDIPGNYPVLFGIANYTSVAALPLTMSKAEVRLTNIVKMTEISHIEVPERNVDETKKLLVKYGYDVDVFPIELGEYVASHLSITELLGITRQKHAK